ncbi:hypothetical protein Tco_1086405 [Tanacetum coccineum]
MLTMKTIEWENKRVVEFTYDGAFDMVGKTGESIPLIFLITEESVEDEKDICNIVKDQLVDGGINYPRICTFGIGQFHRDSVTGSKDEHRWSSNDFHHVLEKKLSARVRRSEN